MTNQKAINEKTDTKLQIMYCNHMQEIKARSDLVHSIVHGKISSGSELHDYEVAALNLRKILELIAFSSLIANKEKYALAHDKFEKHYKAKVILREIEKIHHDFYPKPADIKIKSGKADQPHHVEPLKDSNALTKEEFEELYDKCSKIIHTWNPFDSSPRRVDFRLSVDAWMKKIKQLLSQHYIQLVDNSGCWFCVMNDPKDGQPHVYTLVPV